MANVFQEARAILLELSDHLQRLEEKLAVVEAN